MPAARNDARLRRLYDDWPAPLNNPLVLLAIAAALVFIFAGGGLKLLGGRKSDAGKRRKLRVIQTQALADQAKLLAS